MASDLMTSPTPSSQVENGIRPEALQGSGDRTSPVLVARLEGTRSPDAAAHNVERLYKLADALIDAEKALDQVPFGVCADFDEFADKQIYMADLDRAGKQVRLFADAWQAKLDAELIG